MLPDEQTAQTELPQDGDNRTGTDEETIDGLGERQAAEDEMGNRQEQQPRRSERARRRPIYLSDYVTYINGIITQKHLDLISN